MSLKRCVLLPSGICCVLFFYSCQSPTIPAKPVNQLVENTRIPLLQKQLISDIRAFSDSGTWNKRVLNLPDTLVFLMNDAKFVSSWFLNVADSKFVSALNLQISATEDHGLDPEYYHKSVIHQFWVDLKSGKLDSSGVVNYKKISEMMILSADATLGMYHDLSCGRADPDYIDAVDVLPRQTCKGLKHLLYQENILALTDSAFPRFEPYHALQLKYAGLIRKKDSVQFKPMTIVKPVKPGDTVLAGLSSLLYGLRVQGYGSWPDSVVRKSHVYTGEIAARVRVLQADYGLKADGILTEETVAKCSFTQRTMIARLRASLERWRWLGPIPEHTRIWVNIADNKVYAFKDDTLKVEMRTCSGQWRTTSWYQKQKESQKPGSKVLTPDNLETPLLKARLTHFVVNPTWFVPHLIASKEMLPVIRANPASLVKMNYVVKDRSGDVVSPFDVDWNSLSSKNFPYSIEQKSGSGNSLGSVVIHFPNGYNIYMHDTPDKWFFSLDERHVSHGCIRMEKPMEMIRFITSFSKKDEYDDVLIAMGKEPEKDKELLKKYRAAKGDSVKMQKFRKKENQYFRAESQMPVYLVYFTAFVSRNGAVNYCKDAYNRDEKLIRAMNRRVGKKAQKSAVKRTELKRK